MSQSQTGNWSLVALISCRHSTSGCSRSMNSCTCACRARMPFTFQVAIFTELDQTTLYGIETRGCAPVTGGVMVAQANGMDVIQHAIEETGSDVARLRIGFV